MSTSQKPPHIDIPVTLPELKVAFNVAALAFEGDLSTSISHLQLITKNVALLERQGAGHSSVSYECGPTLHCELRARPGCRALC